MVAFYQHDIANWMDGTEGLSDGEYRAYHVVCQMIYQNNGPIVLHEVGIAARCNQHRLAFRSNLDKLIDKGKIRITPDGKITNARAESELKRITARRRRTSSDPPRTSGTPRGDSADVRPESKEGRAAKSLKDQEPGLFPVPLEEKRIEDIESKPNGLAEQERAFFARGREILGQKEGALISRLFKAKDGNVALARAALEQASQKENPREFIGAILRGPMKSRGGNAFARLAAQSIMNGGSDHDESSDDRPVDERRALPDPRRS